MMNIRRNKTFVCIITTLLIIAGSFLMGKPASTVEASEATAISEKALSVKVQLSEDKTKLRMVTTLDGQLQYKNVGFEVTFLGNGDDEPTKIKRNTVKYVYRRINSTDDAVKYEFGPKAFHASSEWIATYTITNIPEAYRDNGIIIKPYVTMKDTGKRVFGEHRYLTMHDQDNDIVSLPIKGKLTNPTVAGVGVSKYDDGTYTHVRVNAEYDTLPSISTYTVTDGGTEYTEKYRYLHSTVANDQSWYTQSDADDKVIVTTGDMQGFQLLSKTKTFEGEVVYIGADINLNDENWSSSNPAGGTKWTPIGRSSIQSTNKFFCGTFDGNKHSISGVYVEGADRIGLFGFTHGATIKNFELKNSYIKCTNASGSARAGSVVGTLMGTLESVKADETVYVVASGGQYVGGLVGNTDALGAHADGLSKNQVKSYIINCWFAGTVKGTGDNHGGIVGSASTANNDSQTVIQQCLMSGTIEHRAYSGGIVGGLESGCTLEMADVLYAGIFTNVNASSTERCATVLGYDGGKSFSMTNVYVQEDSLVTNLVETQKDTTYEGAQVFNKAQLTGDLAYGNMDVDFYLEGMHEDAAWFAREDNHPILTTFAGDTKAIDLTTASGTRTYWHQPTAGADEFIIYTAADFRGFQALSEKYTFEGDTVKLGGDIDLNPGWSASERAEDETKIAPNAWEVIAKSGLHDWQYFKGTFDGDMHTISGVYIDSTQQRVGLFGGIDGTLKNFILSNSYIESTDERIGGVVAVLNGELNTVKADETVYVVGNNKDSVGGLVGRVQDLTGCSGKAVITNCWFAGTVKGTSAHKGGILGQIKKINTGANPEVTISKCLVTGTIDKDTNTGGIAGSAWTNTVMKIEESLFAGTFVTDGDSPYNIGTIAGNVGNGKLSMNKVYVKEGSGVGPKLGNKGSNEETGATNITAANVIGSAAYCNMNFDFYIEGIADNATWTAIQNKVPALTSFADESQAIDLKTANGTRTMWHQPTDGADEFIIYTAPDFRGFQALSKDYDFKGDTIKLGADIDLNPGWDASNPTVGNATKWNVIGRSGATSNYQFFSGTFDGDMHSVSGVYVQGNYARVGLFGHVTDATIKNFVLKNSYIASTATTNGRVGSIVGTLEGTLDTVKVDETVYVVGTATEYVGGLVGNTDGYKQPVSTINNCWFDGSVSGTGNHRGGILGGATRLNAQSNTTIQNCLVTGDIEFCANVGGIVGTLVTDCTLAISDTLFAGTIKNTPSETTDNYGLVLGNRNGLTPTMSNVYVQQDDVLKYVVGNQPAETYTGVYVATRNQLIGDEAYAHLYIDFYQKEQNETGVWVAVKNSYPILTSFADTSKALPVTVDTSWYDGEQSSYTLNTVAEFRGFQKLAAKNNFHGVEIKLGADIDLNPGWNASETAPETVWTPIGRLATNTGSVIAFRGTFDGQGNTISGVYVNSSLDRIGLFATTAENTVIKNFTLENSYIKNTNEDTNKYASIGSIVGRLGGTLDTVKSTATVVGSGAQDIGGLVGDINSSVGATITNCWFAGHIGGTGAVRGQLLGGVRKIGTNDTLATCTISHCLATGTIVFQNNTGGLAGTSWTGADLSISDTLFAGTILDVNDANVATYTHGTVVGNAKNGKVTITDVYVQKGTGFVEVNKILGSVVTSEINGPHNQTQKANVINLEAKQLYLDDARENTELKIYPQGQDSSSDGDNKQYWWYVSETHPVLASFATTLSYSKLKVATYNIKSGINLGTDNHESVLEDVVAFIEDNNIDVCMLQEVDGDCARTDSVDQAKAIADALGYYYQYVATLTNHTSMTYGRITSFGMAIVSRYPIGETQVEELDFSGQEQKRAILKAMIEVEGTDVAIIGTHFDNAKDSKVREQSVVVLKTMIDGIDPSTPIIFGGDLNQAYAGVETVAIKDIDTFLTSVTKARYDTKTTQAGETWYQLDYIFTNELVQCGYATVDVPTSTKEGLEGELSDHRPLVVNLYMNIK